MYGGWMWKLVGQTSFQKTPTSPPWPSPTVISETPWEWPPTV